MRKIEKEMNKAIRNRENFKLSNTEVVYNIKADCCHVYLHNNHIANVWFEEEVPCYLYLTDALWQTCTTKSRLNAILSEFAPGYSIYQRRFKWRVACPEERKESFDLIDPTYWKGFINIRLNLECKEVVNG